MDHGRRISGRPSRSEDEPLEQRGGRAILAAPVNRSAPLHLIGVDGAGHKSVTITLTVYGHVMPGDQKRAPDRFAALVGEA